MRRPIALLALWLTAAIACTTLGWWTVGMVSGQSRESSLPTLIQTTTTTDDGKAGVVRPQLAITPGSTTTTSASTSTSTTSTSTRAVPGAPLEAPSPADDADPAAGAALPGTPAPQARVAVALPDAPAPTTVAALPASPPPPPPPAPTTSTTITSAGGAVAVSYDGSTGTVSFLWARPNDGFTMDLQHTGPDKVEIRFESDDAESRVFAWWDGAPRQRVEETD